MKSLGWPGHYRWLLPILLLAFLLRTAYLDAQSLWYDEAFYATVSSVDLPSLLDVVLDVRVHPPLYFLILHFWLGLGQSEFVLRTLSAFAGVLTVAGMFPLATRIGTKRLGIISAFGLAISPFHIWYSQEVKMLTLITFLVLLSNYFLVRLLREDKVGNWLGYGIFTLLAFYTHYLTFFVVVAQMTCLTLLRKQHRALLGKWLLCVVIVGLLFAPWLLAILLRGGFSQTPISWIPAAQPEDLFWTLYVFGLGSTSDNGHLFNTVSGLLLVAILAHVSFQLLPGKVMAKERSELLLVWLWHFLPLVLIFLISVDWPLPQKRSIYMDRYLIPLLPAYLILIGYGIMHLYARKKVLGIVTTTALLILNGASVYSLFLDQSYHRDQWRQAITEIRENARSGGILLVRPHHYVVLYYYDLREIPWHTVPYLESKEEYETFLDSEIPPRLSEGGRLWTMIVCENADTHRFVQGARRRLMEKVENDETRAWLLENYQLVEDRVYIGVYLASYGGS